MPTTVKELFQAVGKDILGQVKWGQKINCIVPGVYVIAMASTADRMVCCDEAPISKKMVEGWIDYVPKLSLDYGLPKTEELIRRLKAFWMPDETILYIGKAGTSLKTRVDQYYKTKLGDPKPHRGGHWIKTLDNLNELNIYWTTLEGETARNVEDRFLNMFVKNVSQYSRRNLFDPEHPFPFANLEFPKGTRKRHGIQNQANG
jgi:hypothetical protein